jgi:polyhydroxybutyrate depolymerase
MYRFAIIAAAVLISATGCIMIASRPAATLAPSATALPARSPTATTAPSASPAPVLPPADTTRTLKAGNLQRSYLLHTPPDLDTSRPVPVVFVFHGWRNTASSFQPVGLKELADANGFLLVTPNGSGPGDDISWNAGGCCGSAAEDTVDEAAFVRQMLSDLGTLATLDPRRIYAAGFSNGAMLVYRLACEMADTFAAVAPVAGTLFYSPCQPEEPVSVVHVHGLGDTIVPYAGGGDLISGGFPPVEQSIATWAQLDGCSSAAQVEQQAGDITHTAYPSCQAGSAVELYTVQVLGHGWPSAAEFPAAEVIWDFFAAHPKP